MIKLASGRAVTTRFCKLCAKKLRPKVFPGGIKESPSMYAKRRFCSKNCFYRARRKPPNVRFWRFVKKTPTCWLWLGVKGRDGYGHFHFDSRKHAAGAHRVSWRLKHGRWAKKDVLHKCNVRLCVRPDHLYEGDDFDNCADKRRAGTLYRPPAGEKSPHARFTAKQVRDIRIILRAEGRGVGRRLATLFGVGPSTISRIKLGRVYR